VGEYNTGPSGCWKKKYGDLIISNWNLSTSYKNSPFKRHRKHNHPNKDQVINGVEEKKCTFTIIYRDIILSGLYRWSFHRPFCKTACNAELAAVTICLVFDVDIFYFSMAFYRGFSSYFKKSAENYFLQIKDAIASLFFFTSRLRC
jgi:hypothetical protein